VLLRDGTGGPELLLTVRPQSMSFMGGATVFPGGAVHRTDLDPGWERASGLARPEAAAALGIDDPGAALGYFICALREAYEEVGFLTGSGPLDRVERAAADDPSRWLRQCLDTGVVLGTDALVPAGRWITPVGSPLRFDARFFATRVPDGWEPEPDPSEVERCFWIAPGEAVEELEAGRIHMAPPTIEVLHRLEGLGSVEEVLRVLSQEATARDGPWVTKLHPLVRLILAPNPGVMTGPGTNTYIVGQPGRACFVIDPAVADDSYIRVLTDAAETIAGIIVTHRHPDHSRDTPPIMSVSCWRTSSSAAIPFSERAPPSSRRPTGTCARIWPRCDAFEDYR